MLPVYSHPARYGSEREGGASRHQEAHSVCLLSLRSSQRPTATAWPRSD